MRVRRTAIASALLALAAGCAPSVQELVATVGDSSFGASERRSAAYDLRSLHSRARHALRSEKKSLREKERARRDLELIESVSGREALWTAVRDKVEEESYSDSALTLLVRLGDEEARKQVMAMLDSGDEARRRKAIRVFSEAGLSHLPMDWIIQHFSDPDPELRIAAIRLTRGLRELPAEFVPLFDDEDLDVRVAAFKRLDWSTRVPGGVARMGRRVPVRVLGCSGEKEAEEHIVSGLKDRSSWDRDQALYALDDLFRGLGRESGAEPEPAAATIKAVIGALEDDDSSVRRHAARILAGWKVREATPIIMEAIKTRKGSRYERSEMIETLGTMEDDRAVPLLQAVFGDRRASIDHRAAAGDALDEMGLPPRGLWRVRFAKKSQDFPFMRSGFVAVGVTPLAAVGRTGLDSDLELEEPGAFDATVLLGVENGAIFTQVGYAALSEHDTGKHVGSTQIGLGFGFHDFPLPGKSRAGLTLGYTLLFLDFEDRDRDTLGFGMFCRPAVHLHLWRRWGLDLYADARGWVGLDRDGLHLAGSAGLGASVICSF
jgi:HEAT repeat protein